MNGGVVSATTKTLPKVATSTPNAEYAGVFNCSEEIEWLRHLMAELGRPITTLTPIYCDNDIAVGLAHNPTKMHHATKAMQLKYAKVVERQRDIIIDVRPIDGSENTADLGTKALNKHLFYKHCEKNCTILPKAMNPRD